MEFVPILKQLAEVGISAPMLIGVYGLMRLNHLIANFDKRLSILESRGDRTRCNDK
jgi:hypothetical protein